VLANGQGNGANTNTTATHAPSAAAKNAAPPANPDVTGKGTIDYIPMWDTTSDIIDSIIFQKTSEIGIATTAPAATLDVNGKTDVRDTLTLFPKSTDNTLAVSGTAFKVSSTGEVTFITGQKFAGTGTITGITTASGSGLSGGGTTGTLTLKVPAAGITNAMLADSKITLNASTAGGLTVPGAMTLGDTYTIGLKTCSTNQVLQYSGTAWACASVGTGTITGVTAGTDLTGGGTSGAITLNVDTTKVPQLNAANTFTGNQTVSGTVTATSLSGNGASLTNVNASQLGSLAPAAFAQLASSNTFTSDNTISVSTTNSALTVTNVAYAGGGINVYPNANGTGIYTTGGNEGVVALGGVYPLSGSGGSGEGVFGGSTTDSYLSPGILGLEQGKTQATVGVFGETDSVFGAGVYGQNQAFQSGTGSTVGGSAGVWGDGGSGGQIGVLGTADDQWAGLFQNDGLINYTLQAFNSNSNGYPFSASNGSFNGCYIDALGDILCTGSKNALVPVEGGQRKVALAAIESPKNWFEDFGSERLSNGAAVIALEPEFAQTVNTDLEYHVFLTPKGDCKGLYVANETASSFEVHELGGGSSSVSFDYRIVALRKNFENIRLADHTNDPNPWKTMKKRTPAHFDINQLIPPKREAQLIPSIAPPARK
jgi:hypothetical protein